MPDLARRTVLLGLAATTTVAAGPEKTAWDFSFASIEDGVLDLGDRRGQVLLVTNTASFCGYAYQFRTLEALHRTLSPRGFAVVGVPSQDFNQEADSNGKVKQFCEATFGVQFPMAGISHVHGPEAHPFYRWVRATRDWEPVWNFNKVLIGRDGRIAGLYRAKDEPDGPAVQAAIAKVLGAGV